MYLLVIVLPLLNSIFGPLTSIYNLLLLNFYSLVIIYEVIVNQSTVNLLVGHLFNNNFISLELSFLFDSLTVIMLIPVLLVSLLVQVYSYDYMSDDPHRDRFFRLLSFFTFTMVLLVTSNNLFILFLSLEGVGIASYLLINFLHTRLLANMSSMKAIFINKIGDYTLIITLALVYNMFNDFSYEVLFSLITFLNNDLLVLILVTIVVAAFAKSAQVPLHTLLASAMEAPTPVSALLHSATMVTAGIFLLMRFSPILELSSTILLIITTFGAISAVLGAACGLIDNDIKKIVAYSTISQLGYMTVMCGISQYNLALFHLICHAYFKALLFLASGAIIHSLGDQQDIRRMGSLSLIFPYIYSSFLLGSVSLMAFPFFSGFYTKDYFLELILVPHNTTHSLAYLLTFIAAIFTNLYSLRIVMLTFFSAPHANPHAYHTSTNFCVSVPLLILSFLATCTGYFTSLFFLDPFTTPMFVHPSHVLVLDGVYSEFTYLKLLPLVLFILFVVLIPFRSKSVSLNNLGFHPYALSLNHFNILNHYVMKSVLDSSVVSYRYLDRGLLEVLGPLGLIRLVQFLSFKLEVAANGNISGYFLVFFNVLLLIFVVV